MKYTECLEYMESLSAYGIRPGLESIRELLSRLGNPQDALSFVHIAGTNGKGSTLAYVSTVLMCAGYKVGRYISPTIFEYCERIQVGETKISKKALGDYMDRVKEVCDSMLSEGLLHPSPFEVETAIAFLYFKDKKCDIVVLEAGMGGALDATNVIKNTKVAVLTSISMDHMQFLGDDLSKIATQKAGIIKPGCQVVSTVQMPQAMQAIKRECATKKVSLIVSDESKATRIRYGLEKQIFTYGEYRDVEITQAGLYQLQNAVLAMDVIQSLRTQGYTISDKMLRKGLLTTTWLGRFSVIGKKPYFIVDGAHNEDAAEKLAEAISFYFTNKRIIYIMGMLRDKECEKVIAKTASFASQVITLTPPENARAMDGYELAGLVAKENPNVTAAGSVEEAIELARLLAGRDDVIIAFGSLSYLGRLMETVKKHV